MIQLLQRQPSEFVGLSGIEYFRFEEDFIEQNVRCIPMIVRFKMDAVGIKLKLAEWSRFSVTERRELAVKDCSTIEELSDYRNCLAQLVVKYTGIGPAYMDIDIHPAWAKLYEIPSMLNDRAGDLGVGIRLSQWRQLTNLQRFALIKLSRPGHESRNFVKALKEFGIEV
jgi:hypothetical protein